MGKNHSGIDPDLLLAQTGWVQTLSRSLVHDPSGAEDVAQETLLAALVSPPRYAENAIQLRAWLGRVAFNLAHRASRGNRRRRVREERVARNERQDSTADRVARKSVLKVVSKAVMELEQPYRNTVLLRYFHGLSTSDIAVRTGSTDNAVRKRLFRARGKLRRELDAQHGNDGSWFQALLPLAGVPTLSESGAAPAAPLVQVPKILGAVRSIAASPLLWGGVAAAVAAFAVSGLRATSATERLAASSPVVSSPEAVAQLEHPTLGSFPRQGVTPALSLIALPPESFVEPHELEDGETRSSGDGEKTSEGSAVSVPLRGRVLDLWGTPMAGMQILAQGMPGTVLDTSGADGRFSSTDVVLPGALLAQREGFTTLRTASASEDNLEREHLIVVAPAIDVAGRVVDESGLPLAGATVEVACDPFAFVELDEPLDLTSQVERTVQTDESGRFELPGIATGDGLSLRVLLESFAVLEVDVPWSPTSDLLLGLQRESGPLHVVRGLVRSDRFEPVPDAWVRLGRYETRSDRDGIYTLPVGVVPPEASLIAIRDGYHASEITGFGAYLAQVKGIEERVDLLLGSRVLAIAGHLVDETGRPLEGWVVGSAKLGRDLTEESQLASTALGASVRTRTDKTGRFELEQLFEGTYVLEAFEPTSLLMVRSAPVEAGARNLELRLDEHALRERVSGRIVTAQGRPLAGARVTVSLELASGERRYGASVLADEFGLFELDEVPRYHVEFSVSHPTAQKSLQELTPAAPDRGHRFQVTGRGRLRFDGELGARDAYSFAVLDTAGRTLELSSPEGARQRGRIRSGRSLLHFTSADARTVVLFDREGDEVERLQLEFDSGSEALVVPASSSESLFLRR